MSSGFESLVKIKLVRNGKTPINKWSDKQNQSKDMPDMKKHNVGFLTGDTNKLLVVDVDVKDNGLEEWNHYVHEHGEPETIKIKTPSGGYHYYFNCNELTTYLNTRTKYRGCGIDIRSNGGYVVAPPSSINGNAYEYVKGFDVVDVNDMPNTLITWLMQDMRPTNTTNKQQTQTTIKTNKTQYIYDITDAQIKEMLNKLPPMHLDNYFDWLIITSILKSLDKFDIWDEWSEQSSHYNLDKNITMWNSNKGCIDVNFLVHLLKNYGYHYEQVHKYKPYEAITQDVNVKKCIVMNCKFLYDEEYQGKQFQYRHFNKYETIIIQSITGTGKTTAVAKHMTEYMKQHDARFITITARQSLSAQHVLSFKELDMESYSDKDIDVYDAECITTCINSISKLRNKSNE